MDSITLTVLFFFDHVRTSSKNCCVVTIHKKIRFHSFFIDIDTLISAAQKKLKEQQNFAKMFGKNIPIIVDWDTIKFRLPTSSDKSDTKNIIIWLSVNALLAVLSGDGGTLLTLVLVSFFTYKTV